MKKRVISILLAVALVFSMLVQVFAAVPGYIKPAKEIKVFIKSKEIKTTLPILVNNNRTLYPFRELLEASGAEITWDAVKREAQATYKDKKVAFPIDKSEFIDNGVKKQIDTKTVIDAQYNRTYIPIRYAFEGLGFHVQWIEGQKHNQIRVSDLGPYNNISDKEFVDKYFNYDHTSTLDYDPDIVNKRMVFKDEYSKNKFKGYVLDAKLNPDINRQVYELTKVLADEDYYTYTCYNPALSSARIPSTAVVKFAKTQIALWNSATFFDFIFYEKEPLNASVSWRSDVLSDKVVISLYLNKLWREYEEHWSTPFYEKKLRDSFIALFGQNKGMDIYEFVFGEYIKNRNADQGKYYNTRVVKNFGDIQAAYVVDEDATLHFYFSYNK